MVILDPAAIKRQGFVTPPFIDAMNPFARIAHPQGELAFTALAIVMVSATCHPRAKCSTNTPQGASNGTQRLSER